MAYRRFPNRSPSANQFNNYNNRVADPALKDRLEKILQNPYLQQYPKTVDFMRSLLEQFNAKNSLSHAQVRCLEDNERKFSEDNVNAAHAANKAWKDSFDAEKREKLQAIAKWYKDQYEANIQPFYYREACEAVLSNPDYVPSETLYNKLVENKYSQRYLENRKKPAKYADGDVVILNSTGRKNRSVNYRMSREIDNTFIVVEATDLFTAVNGSRHYKLLPIGGDQIVQAEERFLKKIK